MSCFFPDCCAQQRTYEKFYGLMAQRLCQINRSYVEPFEKIFVDSYTTVHRFAISRCFQLVFRCSVVKSLRFISIIGLLSVVIGWNKIPSHNHYISTINLFLHFTVLFAWSIFKNKRYILLILNETY